MTPEQQEKLSCFCLFIILNSKKKSTQRFSSSANSQPKLQVFNSPNFSTHSLYSHPHPHGGVKELLRRKNPKAFRVLCTVPATFQKDHLDREKAAQFFYRRPHISLNHLGQVGIVGWVVVVVGCWWWWLWLLLLLLPVVLSFFLNVLNWAQQKH